MNRFWTRVYQLYCTGRTATGLFFPNHGAHDSCTIASQSGVWAAWRFARKEHRRGGNPMLPTDVKTFLGFSGGFVLLGLGVLSTVTGGKLLTTSRLVRLSAFFAVMLLAQTFWGSGEQISGGGSISSGCTHVNTYISLDTGNEVCRDCGAEIISDPSEGSNNPDDYM